MQVFLGCAGLLGLSSSLAYADSLVLSDNLAAPTAFTEPVQGQAWVSAAFRSNGAAALANVSLLLANPGIGMAELDLYSGTAQPETLVGSLLSPTSFSSQLTATAFSGNGLALTGATSYWLVLHALSGQFAWAYTESNTGLGVGFVPVWGVTEDAGSTWFTQTGEPMQMRVETTALQPAPEPASFALLFLGVVLAGSSAIVGRLSGKRMPHRTSLLLLGGVTSSLLLSGARTAEAATEYVSVVSPAYGESVTTTASVSVTLYVDLSMVGSPLQVTLNGTDVSPLFRRSGHCGANGCPYQGTVQESDGLRNGTNRLRAGVEDMTGVLHSWRTIFAWSPKGQLGGGLDPYNSPAIGFTTVTPGGGYPWISLFNNAGSGTAASYPSSSADACTTVYQVLALNRQTLEFSSYNCYNTDADFTAALSKFTANDLVVAGTSYGKNSLAKLNTAPIGGTNYGSTNFDGPDFPYGYMIVGAGSATAGTAYENASTGDVDFGNPANYARINGVLATNPNNLYDFHASDYVEFSVRPSDPTTPNNSVSISVGKNKYTPIGGGANVDGFWLLMLDRRNLTNQCDPSDSDPNLYPQCGVFYPTGSTDQGVAEGGLLSLAEALTHAGKSQLLFLASAGIPIRAFSGKPYVTSQLADAINSLGASGYTLERVPGVSSPVYTLVSSNDTGFQKTFTGSAVVSNNIDQVAGLSGGTPQTGFVHGVLGRDNHGLFRPLASSQESQNTIDTANMQDFSAYSLFWTQPVAWPLSDAAHLGAYKYLSYNLVTGNDPNASGTHLDDVRFYYPGSQMDAIRTGATQPRTISCHNPGDTFEFVDPTNSSTGTKYQITYNDCIDVQQQLAKEFGNLNSLVSFFDGPSTGGGLRSAFFAAGSGVLSNMFSAVAAVDTSTAIAGAAQAQADANAAKWLKLAGSVVSAVPGGGALASVTGGILGIAASSVTPPTATGADLASAFAQYESTVSNIYTNQSRFMTNLSTGFDTVLDNTYSDWGKLDAVSAKTSSTNPGGWYVPNSTQLVSLTQNFANSTKRYFYLQALAKAYSMDSWLGQSLQFPSQIGGWVPVGNNPAICETVYRNLPQYSWFSYPSPGNTSRNDIFIIGGTVTTHLGERSEQFPSADLLNTVFGNPLYLQQDLFFAPNGPLPRRGGTIPVGNDVCTVR